MICRGMRIMTPQRNAKATSFDSAPFNDPKLRDLKAVPIRLMEESISI
jgi:hypothetical protein